MWLASPYAEDWGGAGVGVGAGTGTGTGVGVGVGVGTGTGVGAALRDEEGAAEAGGLPGGGTT